MDLVLLAAGNSTRFGANKLLYELDGEPMYQYALERAVRLQREGLLRRVVLVTQYGEIEAGTEQFLEDLAGAEGPARIEVIRNDRPEDGISRSLRLGLQHLLAKERIRHGDLRACLALPAPEACMFGVCDQPYLRTETMRELIRLFTSSECGLAACAEGGRVGNPVIFDKKYYPELLELTGDKGGKRVLLRHAEDAALLETDPHELEDIDYRPEA